MTGLVLLRGIVVLSIGAALVASGTAFGPIGVHFTPVPAHALDGFVLDHFKCYSVEGEKVNVDVTLGDQFSSIETLVTYPRLLCTPPDKDGGGIVNSETHLVCYSIKEEHEPAHDLKVGVANQFGPDQVVKIKETKLLCVPSLKFLDNVDGSQP